MELVLTALFGFLALGICLLALATAASAIHYFIRTRFPKFDLYLYDETARWNARWKRRKKRN